MKNDEYHLTVDVPKPGVVGLELSDSGGTIVASRELPLQGHVDNLLLTGVDNLFKSITLHQSALKTVSAGPGIDRNSSLYRIVNSLGSAVSVSHALGWAGRQRRK